MQIHDVNLGVARRKKRKRVGRGIGSGHGKTSSKGHKGHSSRQGFKINLVSEGGGQPLIRKIPKRGFNNGAFRSDFAIVNLRTLENAFETGAEIDEAALRASGIVSGRCDDGVKVLGDGGLTKALTVKANKFSKSAAEKIAAAGGRAIVIGS